MNTHATARANLERAARIVQEAHFLYQQEAWNLVVRRAQESVELALKAALRWAGLDVPRAHDVGVFLRHHRDRFPSEFAEHVPALAAISQLLSAERSRSFYGDEDADVPPELLYERLDAEQALQQASWVVEQCRRLIERDAG